MNEDCNAMEVLDNMDKESRRNEVILSIEQCEYETKVNRFNGSIV